MTFVNLEPIMATFASIVKIAGCDAYHSGSVTVWDLKRQLVPVLSRPLIQVESARLPPDPHPLQIHGVPVPDARRHHVIAAVRGIWASHVTLGTGECHILTVSEEGQCCGSASCWCGCGFLFDADADPAFHFDADAAGSDFLLDAVSGTFGSGQLEIW